MADHEPELEDPEVIDVMLGDPGAEPMNTLMLERTDVVIPLERDLDGDPFQDDEVWLCTEDGTVVKRLYASDDDVEEDADQRILLYRFRNLRYGAYTVWTKIGGQPAEILRGLVVRSDGVFMNGEALGETRDAKAVAPEPDHASDTPEDSGADDDETDSDEVLVDQADDEVLV